MDTIWEMAAHTLAKHNLLESYLGAWFAIFGQTPVHRKVNYIDGFAGPGVYAGGEEGSPIVALRALLEHTAARAFASTRFNFLFNEQDPARFASLEEQIARLEQEVGGFPPNVHINLENQNFHDLGDEILGSMKKNEGLAPTFFFVDPFGYKDVPLGLMQKLLAFRACEMLIYFDFNSVNRFATAGNVDDRFEALFGTAGFKNAPASGPERQEYLRDLYEKQLREVGNFAYVRSFAMVRESGHIGYYLFFCTRDLQAFDKMKAQMWRLDPTGSFRFEDRLADELVLFGHTGTTDPLRHALLIAFAGQTVHVPVITEWVMKETPFHKGQVKRMTLKPMEDDGQIMVTRPRPQAQFNDQVTVTFP